MSYLDKLHRRSGVAKYVVGGVVETAEFAAASYGFGYVQNRWRERAHVKGVPADLLAGVALKAVALVGGMYGMGEGAMAHVNNVGSAGVAAFFHTLGSGHGAQKAGVRRLLIQEKDVAKAKAALPGATILGEIPKAPHGDFLSAAELAALAR